MTEEEWLTWTIPEYLLHGLSGHLTNRKFRLYATACGRDLLSEFRHQRVAAEAALELAERFADGLAELDELKQEYDGNHNTPEAGWYVVGAACTPYRYQHLSADFHAAHSASRSAIDFAPTAWVKRNPGQRKRSKGAIAATEITRTRVLALLHDIVGNPFRRVAFDPRWRTEHTAGLALRMYDDRDFAAMPILADALEEAGCENADILAHCREPSVHVRGCWVVDLVLGKV